MPGLLGRRRTFGSSTKLDQKSPQKPTLDDSKVIIATFSPLNTLGIGAEGSPHVLKHKGQRIGVVYFNKRQEGKGVHRRMVLTARLYGRRLDKLHDLFDPERLLW